MTLGLGPSCLKQFFRKPPPLWRPSRSESFLGENHGPVLNFSWQLVLENTFP